MHHDINLIIGADDPAPVAFASDTAATGGVLLRLPGLSVCGTADELRAWLKAGLDALDDGPRRNADGTRVRPLKPYRFMKGRPDAS